ncbi:hypothetical protein BGZ83_002767, partial [Gryganskiella cystojenkinii]
IRGYRIELGEIEARLMDHEVVRESLVLAVGSDDEKRLVAYVVADDVDHLAQTLRDHLMTVLPDYMVPAAFVRMDRFPLTPNGKLDRRALPDPDRDAFASQGYEAPQGEIEIALADIWAELLRIDIVGRHDNFFMLGGHSLLTVQMMERLRRVDLQLSIRALFDTPILSALAQTLSFSSLQSIQTHPNLITQNTMTITPDILPLVDLTQGDIDSIVQQVDGGVVNIQDIYALSPLQDGILFHHIMAKEGDPYLLISGMEFDSRRHLDQYLAAFQKVVDRHDILRTGIFWDGLSLPAQVVLRQCSLSVTEVTLDTTCRPALEQMMKIFDPRQHRIDLKLAPLFHFAIAPEVDGRWAVVQLMHHIVGDHSTLEVIQGEIQAFLQGCDATLPPPQPFRNLIAEVRSGPNVDGHNKFFSAMLAEIDTPALPYGISDVHGEGANVIQTHIDLPHDLNISLRGHAKRLGVSLASICHLAWAQVIAATSGQHKVVFGTVLFGRMNAGSGADKAMGLFINTLPIRIDINGRNVLDSVRQTHADLAALLEHEHASLALAQQCSNVAAGIPLFSAILNYRHNSISSSADQAIAGVHVLEGHERTNYPFVISIEEGGVSLGVTCQAVKPFDSLGMCEYMRQALKELSDSLGSRPDTLIRDIQVLPVNEQLLLTQTWSVVHSLPVDSRCVHQLFQAQVAKSPDVIAVVHEGRVLTYGELNWHADRLAGQLSVSGVKHGDFVSMLLVRSFELLVAQLAILKVGAAYVPIDRNTPVDRQIYILSDCEAKVLIIEVGYPVPVHIKTPLLHLSINWDDKTDFPNSLPKGECQASSSHDTAYVMYTSGSTGLPKGVLVPHQGISRLVVNSSFIDIRPQDCVAFAANPAFDASTIEVWAPLLNGGQIVIIDTDTLTNARLLEAALAHHHINTLFLTPSLFNQYAIAIGPALAKLRYLICGGEQVSVESFTSLKKLGGPDHLINAYGPTEISVVATSFEFTLDHSQCTSIPIGRPISNTSVYVLSPLGRLVPLGVKGELYLGGPGVANGYINRLDLTTDHFPPDPFSIQDGARMYRTGDMVRYLPDGNLLFLGRNDNQVKIR